MTKIAVTAALAAILAAPAAFAIQPSAIPETGKLTKAPAGSTVEIRTSDKGDSFVNYYRVGENGSLNFVDQVRQSND